MSPNGDRVAFGWALPDGAFELRARRTDGTWPQTLVARETAYEPVPLDWSKDGGEILCWFKQNDRSADLVLVPAGEGGGAPRVVRSLLTARQDCESLPGRPICRLHATRGWRPVGRPLPLHPVHRRVRATRARSVCDR